MVNAVSLRDAAVIIRAACKFATVGVTALVRIFASRVAAMSCLASESARALLSRSLVVTPTTAALLSRAVALPREGHRPPRVI
jgi:hypothetical protein